VLHYTATKHASPLYIRPRKNFLTAVGFRDEHGLTSTASLKADTVLHVSTVFWIQERDFWSGLNFCFIFMGLGAKHCRPFREHLEGVLCSKCWDRLHVGRSNKRPEARAMSQIIASLTSLRSGFRCRPVCVEFVVDKVALRHVFIRVLRIACVGIIPVFPFLWRYSPIRA
jgi:hypothetical protein